MLENLDYWREAPVWDPTSIAEATRSWFALWPPGGKRKGQSEPVFKMTSAEESLFQRKIKTAGQLRQILGEPPRERRGDRVSWHIRSRSSRTRAAPYLREEQGFRP